MINYNWQTLALYTTDFANQKGYVVNVRYTTIATDGTYTSELQNSATFEQIVNDPDYVPYTKLTNAIVMGWVQEQMGPDQVIALQDYLAKQIQNQINPPQTPSQKPLPF